MATAAQEGRFHLRGGFPSLSTRRCKATLSPLITHSSASAASAICTMHGAVMTITISKLPFSAHYGAHASTVAAFAIWHMHGGNRNCTNKKAS